MGDCRSGGADPFGQPSGRKVRLGEQSFGGSRDQPVGFLGREKPRLPDICGQAARPGRGPAQPLQLQDVLPSLYCRVWYSMFGLELDAKVQTRVIRLFMVVVGVSFSS